MAVNNNADDYANARIGIYFPGVTPYYDGQCVSLVKWFLGEMAGVKDWNAARGNAKDMGRTLVNQGLAYEVPYAQRRRGDVIAYEYGTYGHIAIQLSGGRIFEENVNMPGTSKKWVVDDWVYTSRIGSENEAWRAGKNPHVYRLKGYAEPGQPQGEVDMIPDQDNYYWRYGQKLALFVRGRFLSRAEFSKYIAGNNGTRAVEILSDDPEADRAQHWQEVGKVAVTDNWEQQIYDLQAALKGKVSAEDLAAAQKAAADLKAQLDQAHADADAKIEERKKLDEKIAQYEKELADKKASDDAADKGIAAGLRALWRIIKGGK